MKTLFLGDAKFWPEMYELARTTFPLRASMFVSYHVLFRDFHLVFAVMPNI